MTTKELMIMSNSSLVNYTKLSPNYSKRTSKIKKITIHHMAGNLSVETCGRVFQSSDRKASSNYGIGTDGRVGMYVEEKHRAWTSSNRDNDMQAVTIEVVNDGGAKTGWHISDTALAKTIDLCIDICKRNGIKKLNFTGDASGNLTMHCYFVATFCPGAYLKSKFQYIADEVNKRLSEKAEEKILEDGVWGCGTTKASQKVLGTYVDGIVSNQLNSTKKYLQNVHSGSWQFEKKARTGSAMVRALQKLVGATIDGYMGKNTVKALQKFLNNKGFNAGKVDGYMGEKTVKAWQKFLNSRL